MGGGNAEFARQIEVSTGRYKDSEGFNLEPRRSVEPSPPVPTPPAKSRRFSRPFAWLVVLVVILAATLGTVFTLSWSFPSEVAVVSQGEFTLQVPLMTLYTAPNATGLVQYSMASFHYASTSASESTNFQFSWSLAAAASLPVEFYVRVPSRLASAFRTLGGGSFAYWPAGICPPGCSQSTTLGTLGVGQPYVDAIVWRFSYSVRLMSRLAVFGGPRFLEVDLSPVDEGNGLMGSFEDVGLAPLRTADLLHLGSLNILEAGITLGFSTNDSAIHDGTYGHTSAPVTLEAGDQGSLSVQLTSSFRWSSVDWEVVSLRSGGNITVHEYVDLRFGSINLTVEPYVGP